MAPRRSWSTWPCAAVWQYTIVSSERVIMPFLLIHTPNLLFSARIQAYKHASCTYAGLEFLVEPLAGACLELLDKRLFG